MHEHLPHFVIYGMVLAVPLMFFFALATMREQRESMENLVMPGFSPCTADELRQLGFFSLPYLASTEAVDDWCAYRGKRGETEVFILDYGYRLRMGGMTANGRMTIVAARNERADFPAFSLWPRTASGAEAHWVSEGKYLHDSSVGFGVWEDVDLPTEELAKRCFLRGVDVPRTKSLLGRGASEALAALDGAALEGFGRWLALYPMIPNMWAAGEIVPQGTASLSAGEIPTQVDSVKAIMAQLVRP